MRGEAEARAERKEVVREYGARKNEYMERLRSLSDVVEIAYVDGERYIGQVGEGTLRDGQGLFEYMDGEIYFGGWRKGRFEGSGVYMFKDEEIYDGMLEQGRKHGQGSYYYAEHYGFYQGGWADNLKHGLGLLASTMEHYEGNWVQGVK